MKSSKSCTVEHPARDGAVRGYTLSIIQRYPIRGVDSSTPPQYHLPQILCRDIPRFAHSSASHDRSRRHECRPCRSYLDGANPAVTCTINFARAAAQTESTARSTIKEPVSEHSVERTGRHDIHTVHLCVVCSCNVLTDTPIMMRHV